MYSMGSKQHMYVSDPKLLKELKLQTYMELGTPKYLRKPLLPLIGNSIIRANGQDFAYQKKLIAPEFVLNKVKVIYTERASLGSTSMCLPLLSCEYHVMKR